MKLKRKKERVLFICVANSARSQMAEGLARHLLSDQLEVQSAGSRATSVNPLAIEAMAEIGIDIRHHKSRSVTEVDTSKLDLIISLCAEEVCPIVPAAVKKMHWPVEDPASMPEHSRKEAFRRVRDQIKDRILDYWDKQ